MCIRKTGKSQGEKFGLADSIMYTGEALTFLVFPLAVEATRFYYIVPTDNLQILLTEGCYMP